MTLANLAQVVLGSLPTPGISVLAVAAVPARSALVNTRIVGAIEADAACAARDVSAKGLCAW